MDSSAPLEHIEEWQHVHNTIIPAHFLSLDDVRERAGRHHLELAYDGRGLGERLYERALGRARELGARTVETCVLESNEDGLRFALKHGFVEIDRYQLDGDTATWIDLRLT
ncbi:GNAT family N-acetyltransferase [Streptomyces ipomoeae]|uniref:GNAT family N-acetyltransferase n=1 Tax=Streptomyces ipomoeae TaxID=103232 RepID=UPI00114678AC|nr:GNAT family N-acetyltransferase [Streptomyces ipomoeae]TQE31469.1 GNAT family N-acetyltransferase [Streptomyces ipomoeae]